METPAITDQPSTVLVTGAAGLVGSHLCQCLLSAGRRVVGIDNFNDYYNPQQKRANVSDFRDHEAVVFYETDIRDVSAINDIFKRHQLQAVAHLAAMANVRYSIGRAALYNDVNITGSVNLLEAARTHDVNQFVFASTSSVYGRTEQLPFVETDACNNPLAPYPASKKAIEVMGHSYHNLHGMNFTALRFFSVYGPRARPDMMPFMVTDAIARRQRITLFDNGQMKRDWTYVDDIVAGVVAALDRALGYEVINLGRGEPVLMADFVSIIERLVGRQVQIENKPAPPSEPKINFANIDRAKELLDYHPRTSVEVGLAQLWAWYQEQYM
jgi:UDP-glucuronate 4-epimerase